MGNHLIGVYGGTFDPPHFGHLNMAIRMMEAHHLDEVWFCPAQINPLKLKSVPVSAEHRTAMLGLALEGFPNCRILDYEVKCKGPTYTVDTLRTLIQQEEGKKKPKKFCLIIGDDVAKNFCQWRQFEEIVDLVPIFVGIRVNCDLKQLEATPKVCRALKKGETVMPILDISSTEIRQRLAKGLYCGHLLPAKVIDYIREHRLY